jgi:hypothetical protein
MHQVDLLPLDGRQKLLARACKRLAATFAHTKFAGCPMVAVAAKPGAVLFRQRCQPVTRQVKVVPSAAGGVTIHFHC